MWDDENIVLIGPCSCLFDLETNSINKIKQKKGTISMQGAFFVDPFDEIFHGIPHAQLGPKARLRRIGVVSWRSALAFPMRHGDRAWFGLMIRSSRWNFKIWNQVFAVFFFCVQRMQGLKEQTYQRYQQIPWTNPGTCRWLQVEVVQEQLGLCHLPLLATSLDGASTMKLVAQQQAADVDSCKRDVNSVELKTFFLMECSRYG